MSQRASNKDLDDWDTDPDYVRDMDEMDQRWGGNKRTVGSIDMNELIDNVRREHQNLRDKFKHSSQLGDFIATRKGNLDHEYGRTSPLGSGLLNEERLSKTEVKREVIRSETSSYVKESNDSVLSETFRETSSTDKPLYTTKSTYSQAKSPTPPVAPKPDFSDLSSRLARNRLETQPMRLYEKDTVITTDPPQQFKDSSANKTIFRDEEKSSTIKSSKHGQKPAHEPDSPHAFSKSIQEKIDAFKKEFEDIEHKVARKSDISKVITKTTNVDKKIGEVQYVTRSNEKINSNSMPRSPLSPQGTRPTSASPLGGDNKPKANIKSLSEKFESLGRESSDDFKRRMEERRKEFFDSIKNQVRETRKGLDGFDIGDSDDDERTGRQTGGMKQFAAKLNSNSFSSPLYGSTSSKLSNNSTASSKPKVYTKRETTEEKVVSRLVKENDKIIHDETKRNVERTSSVHGSSDEDEANAPSSIKYLDRELRISPQQRTESPIDEIKRKVPVVEAEPKGAGLMARTLYDYQASEQDELSFDVDDLITNIEKVDQGWYKGLLTKDGRKRMGLFPANYVKLLNETSEY